MAATSRNMQGKVCVVTGANSGIGKVTARALADLGATVVMVCRSEERGRAALLDIERGAAKGPLSLELADMSSLASVRQAAGAIASRHETMASPARSGNGPRSSPASRPRDPPGTGTRS